jgi:hypothetical protein
MDPPVTEQIFQAMFHIGQIMTARDVHVYPDARLLFSGKKTIALVHSTFECAREIDEKKIWYCSRLFAEVPERKVHDLLAGYPRLPTCTLASRLQLARGSHAFVDEGPFVCSMCINAIHLEYVKKHRFWSPYRDVMINLGGVCAACYTKVAAEVSTRTQIIMLLGASDIPQDIRGLIALDLAWL